MPDADTLQRQQVLRRLYTATFLCSCFIVVEVVGGLISGSLAVLSDAAHLFADLASFAVASEFRSAIRTVFTYVRDSRVIVSHGICPFSFGTSAVDQSLRVTWPVYRPRRSIRTD